MAKKGRGDYLKREGARDYGKGRKGTEPGNLSS